MYASRKSRSSTSSLPSRVEPGIGGELGASTRYRDKLMSMRRRSMKKEVEIDQIANVKAGYREDLLPTWGGKTEVVLKQQKCWTSSDATRQVREGEKRFVPRMVCTKTKPQLLKDESGNKEEPNQNSVRVEEPRSAVERNSRKQQNQLQIVKRQALETAEFTERDNDEDSRGPSPTNKDKGCAHIQNNATNRVLARCAEIQSDPSEYQALMQRIKGVKKEHSTDGGRNLVVENKWLCDDTEECKQYWQEIKNLQTRIADTHSVEGKIGLYSIWPHPPGENHSRRKLKEKIKYRAFVHREKMTQVKMQREMQDQERLEHRTLLMNKKEVEAEKKRNEERANRVVKFLFPVIFAANAVACIESRLDDASLKSQELRHMSYSATVIQRRWKQSRAAQTGLKFRQAIRIVRKFVTMATKVRRADKLQQSAQIIQWFLTMYENSNIQSVMRNYRYRVISCQRHFREYEESTRNRIKGLIFKWDQIEKEKIRQEKQKALIEVKKALSEEASEANLMSVQDRGSNKLHDSGVVGPSKMERAPTKILGRKQTVALTRMESGRQVKHGQSHSATGPSAAQKNAAVLAAAVEMGIHVHKKVPKAIKVKLLSDYLASTRSHFKRKWHVYIRDRKYHAANSRMVTVEDVRSVVRAETSDQLMGLLEKRTTDFPHSSQMPFLSLYTVTTNEVIHEMIERGRQMAEDHALNILAAELTDECHV